MRKYCSKCGKELNKRYVDKHYDMNTGQERFNIIWKCPDDRC